MDWFKWGHSTLKKRLKKFTYSSGLLPVFHRKRNRKAITVVVFHRVLPKEAEEWKGADPEWTVTTEFFEDCLQFFKRHYSVVSFPQIMESFHADKALPPNPLLISFDDGWKCNLHQAAPLLKEFGFPAVVFVTTGAIGKSILSWQEALYSLWKTGHISQERLDFLSTLLDISAPSSLENEGDYNQLLSTIRELPIDKRRTADKHLLEWSKSLPGLPYMLNRTELLELQNHGFYLGTHGINHESLVHVDDPLHELTLSQQTLLELTGNPKVGMCFSPPQGLYNQEVLKSAYKAGYTCACTSRQCLTVLKKKQKGVVPDLGRINIDQPYLTNKKGRLDPSKLALLLFRRPIADS